MEIEESFELGAADQHLTFTLDGEIYAFPVVSVREVLQYEKVTKVPQTPDFMRGVINVRGNVLPVVDMRLKFGIEMAEKSVDTSVIITEIDVDGESTMLGALVDAVQEVIDLNSKDISPPPRIGTRLNIDFIKGMGKQDGHFIILLDLEKIFTVDELAVVKGASEVTAEMLAEEDKIAA